MDLPIDCVYMIGTYIDHPRDWFNFNISSKTTNFIGKSLAEKKKKEFKQKGYIKLKYTNIKFEQKTKWIIIKK